MVIKTPTQLKDKTKNLVKKLSLNAQEVQQMYFFERIIDRISKSEYADNFVLKGGLLISAVNGINNRTTRDMDTTVRGLAMDEDEFIPILNKILQTHMDDGCKFTIEKVERIRLESKYPDLRIHIGITFGKMRNILQMDVTTGDVITPKEMRFSYPSLFSDTCYPIMAYPLETILAEKYETLCRRGTTSTRARDFYDIYTLYQLHRDEIDWDVLRKAVIATATMRESIDQLPLYRETIGNISLSSDIRNRIWPNYCKENRYVDPSVFDKALEVAMILGTNLGIEPERKPDLDDELRRFDELRKFRLDAARSKGNKESQKPIETFDRIKE